MLNEFIFPLLLFVTGAVIGSFLNVVILRYLNEKDLNGRSMCPKCKETLRWWELIPIFSFVLLQGRCQRCKKQISVQYPLVETAMGLSVLIIGMSLMASIAVVEAALTVVMVALLLVLFVIDLRSFMLPDIFVAALGAVVIVIWSVEWLGLGGYRVMEYGHELFNMAGGVLVGAGWLGFLWLITRGKGIGLGDIKLMVPLGLFFGLIDTTVLLLLAFVTGGLLSLWLLWRGKVGMKTAIPFGPFLAGAAIVMMLAPQLANQIVDFLWV